MKVDIKIEHYEILEDNSSIMLKDMLLTNIDISNGFVIPGGLAHLLKSITIAPKGFKFNETSYEGIIKCK